jgi:hypothetical protein
MSELSQLLMGITLTIIGIGLVIACAPRRGKTAWFVGNLILEPMLPILFITICAMGLIEITAYFTGIDEATVSGAANSLAR